MSGRCPSRVWTISIAELARASRAAPWPGFDRLGQQRDVVAQRLAEAAGLEEVTLHVDHDDRGARGIDGDLSPARRRWSAFSLVVSPAVHTVRCWRTISSVRLGDLAVGDRAAAVHHAEAAADPAREGELLLDEQHGDPLVVELHDDVADLVDDVGLDALGRLVEDDELGLDRQRAPIASCCCWPPDRSPPRRRSIFFSTGNSVKTCSGICRAVPVGAEPDAQVLLDGEVGKISRPCGT